VRRKLTRGARASEAAGGGGAAVRMLGRAGPLRIRWAGLLRFAGEVVFLFFFKSKSFPNQIKLQTTIEFKPGFESNNQKQCTSMHATVNSYISLIN
jgi:hypothetical protein